MSESPEPKPRSCPFRNQNGLSPPLFEICHLPACPDDGGGKARTYTSFFPDSVELYASHRPSGENIGSRSVKLFLRNCSGVPAFNWPRWSSTGMVQICAFPALKS